MIPSPSVVYDVLAYEYSWPPETLKRLTVGQLRTYWARIMDRRQTAMDAQAVAEGRAPSRQQVRGRIAPAPSGPRPAMEQVSRPDGKVERRYNVWGMVRDLKAGKVSPEDARGVAHGRG